MGITDRGKTGAADSRGGGRTVRVEWVARERGSGEASAHIAETRRRNQTGARSIGPATPAPAADGILTATRRAEVRLRAMRASIVDEK